MSIFQTVSRAAGSLFGGISNAIRSVNNAVGFNAIGTNANTAGVYNAFQPRITSPGLDPNNPINQGLQTGGVQGAIQATQNLYKPQYSTIVPQVYPGSTGAGSNQNVSTVRYSGGSTGTGGAGDGGYVDAPTILSADQAKAYARSAGLEGFNVGGLTYEEADKAINQKKAEQKAQTSALTSATYSPEAISNTNKKLDNFNLTLDSISKDPWTSIGTKQDKISALLKATASDIATDYNTPEEIASAYNTNPTLQASLDRFAQAGGSDQMLVDAINSKNKTQTPNNMTTAEYLASQTKTQNDQATQSIVLTDPAVQAEIARTAGIPENLKKFYFGDGETTGLLTQRIKIAEETKALIERKMLNEESNLRAKANYEIQKNNADLDITRNTIEQNRLNAKNYITGMLAKLGALSTTSEAPIAIANLDEKYQAQKTAAESKVALANQEIEISLRDAINKVESAADEKIVSIKEDLSKDVETVQKEIMKAQQDSDKRIYDLTQKSSARMQKNINDFNNTATSLAENYTREFTRLASQGFDPATIASSLNVKLPAADQKVSASARIKDPNAISYFQSLPKEFQNEWIQFASGQPVGRYFTLADLQANYEPYQLEAQQTERQAKSTNAGSSLSDL